MVLNYGFEFEVDFRDFEDFLGTLSKKRLIEALVDLDDPERYDDEAKGDFEGYLNTLDKGVLINNLSDFDDEAQEYFEDEMWIYFEDIAKQQEKKYWERRYERY